MEKRLLAYYNRLNDLGRVKVEEYVKDISRIAAYEEKAASTKQSPPFRSGSSKANTQKQWQQKDQLLKVK